MSEYTTGELAKLVDISIRSIQYYDKKNLLKPSQILAKGKRIYDDNSLSRLKLILLLKNLGLSLKAIGEILDSPNAMAVLDLLLEQQLKAAKDQIKNSKDQAKKIEDIKRNLPKIDQIKIQTIDDIDDIMNNKKSLRKVHLRMIMIGIPMDIIEVGTLAWGIIKGEWIPFVIGIIIVLLAAIWISYYYYESTNYICPNCNSEFKPRFKAVFFASHNIRARKLVCPTCGKKSYCVEVYDEKRSTKKVE